MAHKENNRLDKTGDLLDYIPLSEVILKFLFHSTTAFALPLSINRDKPHISITPLTNTTQVRCLVARTAEYGWPSWPVKHPTTKLPFMPLAYNFQSCQHTRFWRSRYDFQAATLDLNILRITQQIDIIHLAGSHVHVLTSNQP